MIEAEIIARTEARGAGKTICPSEVARALARNAADAKDPEDPEDDAAWRALMPNVRAVAADLCERGAIAVLQKGRPVDPRSAHGPIRLAIKPDRSGSA